MHAWPSSDCPVLPSSIPNGFVNGNGSVEGSLYQFSCIQGYSLVGRDTLFCNHKGAWSGSVPKCLKDCPPLAGSIDNGYKHGSGTVEGSLAWFSCKDGYSLVGNQYLYCNEKGHWNGTTPSCLKDCPPINLTFEHGLISGNRSTSGAAYSFSCDDGYSINGQVTLICNEYGQWNGSIPVCSRVLTGKKETRKAWYVYAASGAGSLLFLLILASLLVLLWRRRRSSEKRSEIPGTDETEMKTMVTSPKKTQVNCDYSLVSEGSKAPPTVV
ncbi:E-selectin-like isoform X2 [Orbicella faveolata]|uniref:E-selectin-like isoform X2 n=1 Tax=Orbicella faveolata TaxID=48498 RepID=UPI0009E44289|nr:E-selectin-like isoform X2 [Orbicella faveolata]